MEMLAGPDCNGDMVWGIEDVMGEERWKKCYENVPKVGSARLRCGEEVWRRGSFKKRSRGDSDRVLCSEYTYNAAESQITSYSSASLYLVIFKSAS